MSGGRGNHSKGGLAAKIRMAHESAPNGVSENDVLAVAKRANEEGRHPEEIWSNEYLGSGET